MPKEKPKQDCHCQALSLLLEFQFKKKKAHVSHWAFPRQQSLLSLKRKDWKFSFPGTHLENLLKSAGKEGIKIWRFK